MSPSRKVQLVIGALVSLNLIIFAAREYLGA